MDSCSCLFSFDVPERVFQPYVSIWNCIFYSLGKAESWLNYPNNVPVFWNCKEKDYLEN